MKYYFYPLFILFSVFTSCQTATEKEDTTTEEDMVDAGLSITKETYGNTKEGTAFLYTLENRNGMLLKVTNYGGILTALQVPNKTGKLEDVTLGFDSLAGYQGTHPYFGALIGRYGNRIANGKFSIDGETYNLATNNGPNSLHGGIVGFSHQLWTAQSIETDDHVGIELKLRSEDMEEGFPGNLDVIVRYFLNNNNEWTIEYESVTDKKTPVNLTQHAYFNLNGAGNGDILDHEVMINADEFTPVDNTLIPTGELKLVEGTPFDFRQAMAVGARIEADDQQIEFGGGYDHNWVLNKKEADELILAATVYAPKSGRFMEVLTTEPGIQFYTGNFLDGSLIGKGNKPYQKRSGLCLETQHYPDSPNQENFPSTILAPEEKYETKTVYRFSVK